MSKSKTMLDERVVNSDEFMALSIESQCLYFHLNLDANNIGELAGVKRLARGYGFGDAQLEELREAGYLLEIDGRWFIAHYYVNNTLSSNARMREAARRSWESRPPSLAYEGEAFKSKLVQRTECEHSADIDEVLSRNCNGNGICTENVSVFETVSENVLVGEGGSGEGEAQQLRFAPCPECGAKTLIGPEGHMLHGTCPECDADFFIDQETGQYMEGVE